MGCRPTCSTGSGSRLRRLPELIADMELGVVKGGPHAIPWTHTDEVNAALLRFLGHPAA
jgi:pimeloyl-ACP methyl ester carboxylesterase